MIASLILFLGTGLVGDNLSLDSPDDVLLYNLVGGTIVILGFMLVPLAIAVAILKRGLWNIDIIINRTLVYIVLSGCLLGIYALIATALGALLRVEDNPVVTLIATAAVAVAFAPLRERLQRAVNRLMYGERHDPYEVLVRLGKQLELKLDPSLVLPTILETLVSALKLPHASIYLEHEDLRLSATVGAVVGQPLSLPLMHEGRTLGALKVAEREGEAGFSKGDRRLLRDFARQVSVAAGAVLLRERAVRLADDLQQSRQRLVSAREEERRRLRRDLHDGLGPALASQTLLLDAGRKLLRQDPRAAEEMLGQLSTQMQEAVRDIRRVVYGLRPPALDQLGLVGALNEQAHRMAREGLRVNVDAATLPSMPAAVEVAALRIASEAMTNVVRHAGASVCDVRLNIEENEGRNLLSLEVTDDGPGLPPHYRPGVGHHGVRERAAELGGSCTIEGRSEGGTRVRAMLPICQEEP